MVQNHKLILASASPRRKELLKGLDLDFTVDTKNNFVEEYPEDLLAKEIPLFLAKGKSYGFHRELLEDEILITADTVVLVDGAVIGKPHSKTEAIDMLTSLSGKAHEVITGVMLRSKEKEIFFSDTTKVYFSKLTPLEIDYYIEKYKPFDKAGGYGIQEWIGYALIEGIEGSYFNVMGLPVHRIYQALQMF